MVFRISPPTIARSDAADADDATADADPDAPPAAAVAAEADAESGGDALTLYRENGEELRDPAWLVDDEDPSSWGPLGLPSAAAAAAAGFRDSLDIRFKVDLSMEAVTLAFCSKELAALTGEAAGIRGSWGRQRPVPVPPVRGMQLRDEDGPKGNPPMGQY